MKLRPDFGETLWAQGMRDQRIIVQGLRPTAIMKEADGYEVHGFTVPTEGATHAISIALGDVDHAALLRVVQNTHPDFLVVEGRLDTRAITGAGGEVFRRIIGRIHALPEKDDGKEEVLGYPPPFTARPRG